tara:strand:+ start:764 stop:1087 length:324 start_codon:yes stop_codon:yes gene_type:complete
LTSDSGEFSSQSDPSLIQTHKLAIALTPENGEPSPQLNRFKPVANCPIFVILSAPRIAGGHSHRCGSQIQLFVFRDFFNKENDFSLRAFPTARKRSEETMDHWTGVT